MALCEAISVVSVYRVPYSSSVASIALSPSHFMASQCYIQCGNSGIPI